jgi:hypothetical protein
MVIIAVERFINYCMIFDMNIIIHTVQGTFIVPPEKEPNLIAWLEQNAVKAGPKNVKERLERDGYTGRQLINENKAV